MKITIKVTKEVLEKSRFCGYLQSELSVTESCAIALAVRDIFPKAGVTKYKIFTNIESIEIPLPTQASNFIARFDTIGPKGRMHLDELSFEIDIPEELVNEIGISEITEIINKSQTLEIYEEAIQEA